MTKISEIVDFNGSRDISEISEREFKGGGSKFQDGDTLFARITPCLENGKTVKVSGLGTDVFAHGSTEFIVMVAKEPYYDEYYVYYLARLPDFRAYAQARMEGTSGRQRVSWQSLSEFEFDFPEKEERKTIGMTFKAFDDKIALNRQINQTLESMAQAIFKSWFVNFDPVKAKIAALESGEDAEGVTRAAMRAISGKTDDELDKMEGRQPEDFAKLKTTAKLFPAAMQDSELGEVPEGWDILDFEKFVSRSNEKVGTKEVPEYSSTNYGLKLRSETFNKQLSKKRSNNKLIRNNDLVFGLSRQILNFGLMRDEIGAVSPVYNVFSINTKMIVSDFVEKYIRERMNFYYGMINGSSREGQSISVKQFLKMPFLIPPLKVQKELYSYLLFISKIINQNQCEINILLELRDILLPKLLSGELSVDTIKIINEQAGE
jgi:type I restriction enzyme S subunit